MIRNFFKKYAEVILYLVFGVLTTGVSIGTFWLFQKIIGNELVSNIISWIISVTFAFITNKLFVFSPPKEQSLIKQIIFFYLSRLTTLGFEEGMLAIFVTWLKMDALIVKIVLQVVVIILNYFLSKFIVFRKKKLAENAQIKQNDQEKVGIEESNQTLDKENVINE